MIEAMGVPKHPAGPILKSREQERYILLGTKKNLL
jgi:hypothetical protein